MSDSSHERLAGELDSEAEKLEHHVRELQDEIEDVKADWQRKRADRRIPGAPPPDPEHDAPGED